MFDPSTKILVVDDMLTMRKLVGKALKEIGFTDIVEAADGGKGWEAINSAEPYFGLVVSDLDMPTSNGLDLLKRVRGDGRFTRLPFMLMTLESEQHQLIEAIKAGVSGYVVKPFTTGSLKEKLSACYDKLSIT